MGTTQIIAIVVFVVVMVAIVTEKIHRALAAVVGAMVLLILHVVSFDAAMEHVDFKDTFKPGDKEIRNCHINIGTGKEITIRQLAELIVNTVGYQGRLTFDTSKPDGTMRKLTDPGKLHALGWHHKIDIEEGVQRMYRWYLGK